MRCRRVRKQLFPYVFDELTTVEKKEVERHLIKCEQCSNEIIKIKRVTKITAESLKPVDAGQATEHLWFELFQRMESEGTKFKGIRNKKSNKNLRQVFRPGFNFTHLGIFPKPVFAFLILFVLVAVLTIAQLRFIDRPKSLAHKADEIGPTNHDYEIVERVNIPEVTVLTYQTSDPNIKIVWIFNNNLKI